MEVSWARANRLRAARRQLRRMLKLALLAAALLTGGAAAGCRATYWTFYAPVTPAAVRRTHSQEERCVS
jgi:hypothetical protein